MNFFEALLFEGAFVLFFLNTVLSVNKPPAIMLVIRNNAISILPILNLFLLLAIFTP